MVIQVALVVFIVVHPDAALPLSLAYSSCPEARPSASALLHVKIVGGDVSVTVGDSHLNVGRMFAGPPPRGAPPRIQLPIFSLSAADGSGSAPGGICVV